MSTCRHVGARLDDLDESSALHFRDQLEYLIDRGSLERCAVTIAAPQQFLADKGDDMTCRGVRGATTVQSNTRDEILAATTQLLALMIRLNGIEPEDVASALFTVTMDLDAEFPALAARRLGWMNVPLMCSYEVQVPDSLPRCIRILVNWNTDKSQKEIVHAYVNDAKQLRPDLSQLPPVDNEELERWISEYIDTHETGAETT